MPASLRGWRKPALSAIAPPCEKPARKMFSSGTPRAFSRAISASTAAIDSRIPASSWRARASKPWMSYQARIGTPPLIVTGCTGAWGNTKRSAGQPFATSSGTIGAKSLPSAPRPCSQRMLWAGLAAVSCSTVGSRDMASIGSGRSAAS